MVGSRKVFRTANNLVGIGPIGLEKGDRVVVFFGAEMPFIIGDRIWRRFGWAVFCEGDHARRSSERC